MLITILACSLLSSPSDSLSNAFDAHPSFEVGPVGLNLFGPAELSLPPAAQEEKKADAHFSYTYVELGASTTSLDDTSVTNKDVESYYLRASLALGMFHLFASYEDQNLDFMNTKTSLYRLGAGVHFPVGDKFSLFGEAAWLYSDLSTDIAGLDDTNDGWEGRGGARWMPFVWNGGGVELDGNILYVDLTDRLASSDSATGWEAGGQVFFARLFSVGAMYSILEGDDTARVFARVSF